MILLARVGSLLHPVRGNQVDRIGAPRNRLKTWRNQDGTSDRRT